MKTYVINNGLFFYFSMIKLPNIMGSSGLMKKVITQTRGEWVIDVLYCIYVLIILAKSRIFK